MFIGVSFCFITSGVQAATHYALIINQVRGSECCDVGERAHFQLQLNTSEQLDLATNFALRYDVLQDQTYLDLIGTSSSQINYGGFLEITPQLAKDAGVRYLGGASNWYQANYAYLIGYSQEERQAIIDQYMTVFKQQLGFYPNFTTAWMIDPLSLQYLKTTYGIQVHQITREQFSTDSYTLDGGPPHYPYFPSGNWALIPNDGQVTTMPLLVRQTITDPVYNYGDQTNSFTSQPNDYALRDANLDYFRFIFSQAENQPNQNYSFALIGLENSMPAEIQSEYKQQLTIVSDWQADEQNLVVTTTDFYQQFVNQKLADELPTVYHGQAENDVQEQAWWITTPDYRARVRLSGGELFISDLRVYAREFTDPYLTEQAANTGRWLVPAIFNSSISYGGEANDPLVNNDSLLSQPDLNRITLATAVTADKLQVERDDDNNLVFSQDNQPVATFRRATFAFNSSERLPLTVVDPLTQESLWALVPTDSNSWQPQVYQTDLTTVRGHQAMFSAAQSQLVVSNRYAMAARNPIRLIFYPRNLRNENIYLPDKINVDLDYQVDQLTIAPPNPRNGMIFIDIDSSRPVKTKITIDYQDYTQTETIYFAPACGDDWQYCLVHPRQAWWYVCNWFSDRWRLWQNSN